MLKWYFHPVLGDRMRRGTLMQVRRCSKVPRCRHACVHVSVVAVCRRTRVLLLVHGMDNAWCTAGNCSSITLMMTCAVLHSRALDTRGAALLWPVKISCLHCARTGDREGWWGWVVRTHDPRQCSLDTPRPSRM
jgi:hypothetical protein